MERHQKTLNKRMEELEQMPTSGVDVEKLISENAKLKAENERLTNESKAYEQAKKELKEILEVE